MDKPLAFEELFRPLVLDAESALHQQTDAEARDLLTPEAHVDWTRYLLARLTAAGSEAAHWQLQIYKTVRTVFPVEKRATKQGSKIVYLQFIGSQPRDRLWKLFDEFPALAELCSVLVKNWLATVDEFLVRLQADHRKLRAHFPSGSFTCPVARLQPGLSDPHNGGRSVVRLSFADGTSLIYKPRSLAPEAHFAALLEQLNVSEVSYPLKSARCWDRGEYGWMENVAASPCSSIEEVHRFYWRAGALLGLIYLARGVDFHRENLIAAGQYPVLIDLETLWHPQNCYGGDISAVASVLYTGFLPQLNLRSEKHYQWSALSRAANPESMALESTYINHARTMQKPNGRKTEGSRHLPTFLDAPRPAAEFIGNIEAGFRWVGKQMFGAGQEQFRRWRDALTKQRRRFIRRSTARYQSALKWLTTPQYLRQTSARDELMARSWSAQSDKPLLPDEIHALGQMDIPYLKQGGDGAEAPNAAELEEFTEETYLAQIPIIVGALTTIP